MISFENIDMPNIIKIYNVESIFYTFPLFRKQESMAHVINITKKFAEDVIVMDDGSTDKMTEQAQNTAEKVISHIANLGYGAAIASCLRFVIEASADVIIILKQTCNAILKRYHSLLNQL
jgi:glycosyltransferase involved in cell wall biosynthesis